MTQSTLDQNPPALSVPKGLRMPSLNQVRLTGHLMQAPRIRTVMKDKMVVHLNLAVNESYRQPSGPWKNITTFVPVTAWNGMALSCGKRLKIGSPLYVEGWLRSDRWKTTDGQARQALKVQAARIQFLNK